MNKNDIIPWAAGLFEGEGTIAIKKYGIRIAIAMTDLDVLQSFKDNFGGSLIEEKKRQSHHKQCWKWYLTTNESTYNFLKKIMPYLHERRANKAKEAISKYEFDLKKSLLKRAQVKELRHLAESLNDGILTHKEIAIKLNVSRSYISHILNGDYE